MVSPCFVHICKNYVYIVISILLILQKSVDSVYLICMWEKSCFLSQVRLFYLYETL